MERQRTDGGAAAAAYALETRKLREENARLREVTRYAMNMLELLPSGIDYDADPEDPSPEDAVAHIGGLLYRELEKALEGKP